MLSCGWKELPTALVRYTQRGFLLGPNKLWTIHIVCLRLLGAANVRMQFRKAAVRVIKIPFLGGLVRKWRGSALIVHWLMRAAWWIVELAGPVAHQMKAS